MGVAGFVDIHCHLIAGVDDGPKDHRQTRALIDAARSSGIAAIVATPHFSSRYRLDSAERDVRLAAAERIAGAAPLLFAGCELELTEERLQQFFENPRRYTLNGSRYVLVELPHSAGGGSLDRAARLFRSRGLQPILAHPERYPFLPADSPAFGAWIANGGLLQATAASFTGRMGRRAKAAAYELLSRDALHFVASDAHDAVKRGPDMRQAFANVAAARDILAAGRLFTHNPLAVIRDELLA
jgi:protein-tyrosine phosphatase